MAGEAERDANGFVVGGNAVDCFVVCAGSEFVETYVGRGAARVRGLFKTVRQEAARKFQQRQNFRTSRQCAVSIDSDGTEVTTRVSRVVSSIGNRIAETMHTLVACTSQRTFMVKEEDGHRRPMAIIFIDEIDALAKRRGSGMDLSPDLRGGGCDEREVRENRLSNHG